MTPAELAARACGVIVASSFARAAAEYVLYGILQRASRRALLGRGFSRRLPCLGARLLLTSVENPARKS